MVHSALAVPEILRLICELLKKSDQARLLTVSCNFFACTAPLVWSTISGPEELPGLLPTVNWARVEESNPFSVDVDDQIQPLEHQSIHRFNVYAAYVRRLQQGPEYRKRGAFWESLLKVVPARPILPKLQALVLSQSFWYRRTKIIPHMDAFLCPTLTEIRCPGPGDQILNTLLASQLSARLVQHCPNIHTLDIYTDNATDDDDHEDTLQPGLGPLSSTDLSSSLAQFHNLRSLGGGPELLSPESLVTLGSLPLLESFTIVDMDKTTERLVQSSISLPQNTFPALQHLGIYSLDRIERASELWNFPYLVQQLISVHVDLDSASVSDEQIRLLICSICANSPLVSELYIGLEPTDNREDIDLFSPTVVSHLQQLPLRRLRISASSVSLEPAGNFEPLALALMNIEYLHMRCCNFTFEDLVLVAKHMPKLQFLATGLPRPRWPSEDQLPRLTNPNSPLCLLLSHNEDEPGSSSEEVGLDNIKSMSLALHSLWPNGVHCAVSDEEGLNANAHVRRELDLINTKIRELCASKVFSVPSFEDLAIGWTYVNKYHIPWLPCN